jgi:hypothetical protein
MSLLRVLAVLVVAGVLGVHALPAAHHAAAAHPVAATAPDAAAAAPPDHHAVAGEAHPGGACDLACQTGIGVVMLCVAVLGAALAFVLARVRRGWLLSRPVRPPPSAVMFHRRPLLRPPDLVAGLCVSRT